MCGHICTCVRLFLTSYPIPNDIITLYILYEIYEHKSECKHARVKSCGLDIMNYKSAHEDEGTIFITLPAYEH
jgi:hypothetical protein